jgi:TonB family protein
MKNSLFTLILFLLFTSGFSQNLKFEYTGRQTPSIRKVQLKVASSINEIMPEFSRYFRLPFNENQQFNKRIVTIYPQANYFPDENYNYIFDYISVEIAATGNGKTLTSLGTSDALTSAQKSILNEADMGTDIRIKIKFRFKNESTGKPDYTANIEEGEYTVTVVPEAEAEYPGGFRQFSQYLTDNVFTKISESKNTIEKIQQAVLKFTVDEAGQIVDARIFRTSTDTKIDDLLLDAMNKMPKWSPAEDTKGIKVRQEFNIALGGGGC